MALEHDLIYKPNDYGEKQLNPVLLREAVKKASYALSRRRHKFDSIVVRGVSGLLIGAPVAVKTGIPLVIVRKANESTHDSNTVINRTDIGTRCVFLDDFSLAGETEDICRRKVEEFDAHIVMCYFYARKGWAEPRMDPRWKIQEANRKALIGETVQDAVVVDALPPHIEGSMPIDWHEVDNIWSNVPTESDPSTILGERIGDEYRILGTDDGRFDIELMRRSWAFEFKTTPRSLIDGVSTS